MHLIMQLTVAVLFLFCFVWSGCYLSAKYSSLELHLYGTMTLRYIEHMCLGVYVCAIMFMWRFVFYLSLSFQALTRIKITKERGKEIRGRKEKVKRVA